MEFYVIRDKEPTKKNGEENELMHFGILGMKWGIRRYQNKDGSLTPAGKKRYSEKTSLDKGLLNKNAKNAEKTPSDRMSEELQGLKLVEDDGRHFTQEYGT